MGGCGSGCGCGGGDLRGGSPGGRPGPAGPRRFSGKWLVIVIVAGIVLGATLVAWIAFRADRRDGVEIIRAAQTATSGQTRPSRPDDAATPPAPTAAAPQDYHRFGAREPLPKPEHAIRLANYNLLNLFDEIDDPNYSGRNEDIDDAKPLAERQAAANAIRAIDADILTLQEIESKAALEWFVSEHLDGMGYEYIESIDVGDARGIEQAILSRFPIVDAQVWPGEQLGGVHPEEWGRGENFEAGKPIAFRRSPLRVTVRVPGQFDGDLEPVTGDDISVIENTPAYTLTLFIVHHKSGGPGGYWREREAARIVQKAGDLLAADPDANVAIVGDFNCQRDESPLQMYFDAGFTSALLEAAALSGGAAGPGNRHDPQWVTHESGRIIDHILVNANLEPEIVDGSAFVFGTPARPEGSDWRTTPPPPGFASDHYPIVVDLIPKD